VFDLGISTIDIPKSESNFLPTPHRIPFSESHSARPNTLVPFFVTTNDGTSNVSLRALCPPGGIAYVDLLFYDFTDNSRPIGDTVTWGPSEATRLYTRIELVGPNASPSGYATPAQRTQLTWLHSVIDPANGYRDTSVPAPHQHQAFLHLEVNWGFDSAARLPYARVSKVPPQRPRPPPPDVQVIYRLGVQGEDHAFEQAMQPWACILCCICAPFPSLHILQIHIERAHAQVQTTIAKEVRQQIELQYASV
jgi:hypothetical protein